MPDEREDELDEPEPGLVGAAEAVAPLAANDRAAGIFELGLLADFAFNFLSSALFFLTSCKAARKPLYACFV